MFKKLLLTVVIFSTLFTVLPVRAEDAIPPIQRLGTGIPTSIAASPDGVTLAVGSSIGVWLLDANTLQPFNFWDTGFWVNTVEYSIDGKYVEANDIVLDASNGQRASVDAGQVKWINDQCSPNGALCANYHPVSLYRYDVEDHIKVVDTNTTIDVALIRQWNPQDIAWSPDNLTLYVLARGSYRVGVTIRAWSTQSWNQTRVLKNFVTYGNLCEWYGAGLFPCKPSPMRAWWHDIHVYDPKTGALIKRFAAHHLYLSAAKLSLDERLLATSGTNAGKECGGGTAYWWSCDVIESSTKIWDFASQKPLAELPVVFTDVAFTPDKNIIVGETNDGYEAWDWKAAIRLWTADDDTTGICRHDIYIDKSTYKCISISPDGRFVATGTNAKDGNVVRIRRLDTGALLANLSGHTDTIISVLFSPDGTKIAAGSLDGTILIWPVP